MPGRQGDGGGFALDTAVSLLSFLLIWTLTIVQTTGRIIYRTIIEVRNEFARRNDGKRGTLTAIFTI